MSLNANQGGPQGLTMDLRSLERLKANSGANPRAAIRDTARQLETLFMQELMKSMRASSMDSGMLSNQGTELGTSMLDTQMAGKMSGMKGGLGELITRQLERQMGLKPEATAQAQGQPQASVLRGLGDLSLQNMPGWDQASEVARATAEATARAEQALRAQAARAQTAATGSTPAAGSAQERFIRKHHDAAKVAEAATGIPSGHILGQAALESGWGKHEIRTRDGQPSHNLFGIKATSDWKGKVAEVTTTEYIGGVPRKVTARFRAYDSYAEAFTDHARLLTRNARYSETVAQADTARGYANGLQKAGYATDPAYADKLTKVINTALRVQRGLA